MYNNNNNNNKIMKTIKDSCIDLLKNEDIRKDMREMIRPICQIIYNEIYIYVWFICLYNVFFIVLLLFNLFLLLRFLYSIDKKGKELC